MQQVHWTFRVLIYLQLLLVLASTAISPNLPSWRPLLVLVDFLAVLAVVTFLVYAANHGLLTRTALEMGLRAEMLYMSGQRSNMVPRLCAPPRTLSCCGPGT